MSDLQGFRRRTSPVRQDDGGYKNEIPMATEAQIEYINNLYRKNGRSPLTAIEARKMTKVDASRTIQAWKDVTPPPDLADCPVSWDSDIWHLMQVFARHARADDIELSAPVPGIYAEIEDLVDRWNMREKSASGLYVQEVSGCARRELSTEVAAHCWYHYPPGKPDEQEQLRVLTWVEVVEIVMAEFWSRIWNEHALDQFRQHFAEYGMEMTRHWKSLRIIREINAQPKDHPRPIVRRRVPSGTIAGDSKEG